MWPSMTTVQRGKKKTNQQTKEAGPTWAYRQGSAMLRRSPIPSFPTRTSPTELLARQPG